jgi:hypothetical protein
MTTTRNARNVPHYRIDCPHSGLSIRFVREVLPGHKPRIVPRLVPPADADAFKTRRGAIERFARYLIGQPLDIVRVEP